MTYKCKICGGSVVIDNQSGVMVCDYCGTKQALPLFTEDSARLLYERGNNYLLQSEYDKAENVFSQLLTITPNDPELYWDLVLCKYGVTYVKDPKTKKYIPTCNRTHYTPIFKDENYLRAIELSGTEKRNLYKSDAETIDNIQKGILAVSKKEKPFDIFISYKETDVNGNRTKDSIEAQNLYEKLTEAGYKVFFSRITLEDKIGTEYEPYIYAALYSSKVMLTVCSSKENIDAVWVKNEWSRFLQLRQNDGSKTLLPLYFDMEKSDLPDEFALLSSHNMKKEGFEQELLRGIKKLIPLPIMKAKRRKQMARAFGISAAVICAFALIGALIYLPTYTKAQDYKDAIVLFENAEYDKAKEAFTQLGDFKDSAEMVKNCEIQPEYDKAMQLYYDGNYAESTWAFEKLGDYSDAKEQKEKAELSWRKSLANIYCRHNYFQDAEHSEIYVTESGTVKVIEENKEKVNDLEIDEHGKIISVCLGYGEKFAYLYEDGFFSGTENLKDIWKNVNEKQKSNIIKVTGGPCNIALSADGTMIYPEFSEYELCFSKINNNRLAVMKDWNHIVDFDVYYQFNTGGELLDIAVIAVKSDGTLYSTHTEYLDYPYVIDFSKIDSGLPNFSNVKQISIISSNEVIAVTKDGKLQHYYDGKFSEKDYNSIVTIKCGYALKNNGELINIKTNKVITKNIAYINECDFGFDTEYNLIFYAVTKTGTVTEYGITTKVHEEWKRRLK